MKKVIVFLSVCFLAFNSKAQSPKEPPPPYLKTRTIPNFIIAKLPDSTKFTNMDFDKNKKTIIIYFGPECGHCSVFTKKLMDSIDLIKNTQILMVSSFDYGKIQKFYNDHKLFDVPFITCGKDENFFFISHYGVRSFPSAYVYNSKGRFVKKFETEIGIKELADIK